VAGVKIEELSVKQIDRALAGLGSLLGDSELTCEVLQGSETFRHRTSKLVSFAVVLVPMNPDAVLKAALITGIEIGFALRDVAAVDEGLGGRA
jgi:hypothetical protein